MSKNMCKIKNAIFKTFFKDEINHYNFLLEQLEDINNKCREDFSKLNCKITNLEKDIESKDDYATEIKEDFEKVEKENTFLKNFYLDYLKERVKNLSEENIKRLYTESKELDYEGWIEFRIIKKKIKINLSDEYYYEDNLGLFEFANGYELIHYYEQASYAEIESSVFIGSYEKCYYGAYEDNSEFIIYRNEVMKETIISIAKEYPEEVYSLINEIVKEEVVDLTIDKFNDGKAHYFKLVDNLNIDLKPYIEMPMYDENPDLGTFHSTLGVPHPGHGDYLIYEDGEIDFISSMKDFSEVSFSHKMNTEELNELLRKHTINEVNKEVLSLDLSLSSKIEKLYMEISARECELDTMKYDDEGIFTEQDMKEHESRIVNLKKQLAAVQAEYDQNCKI
ncbi:hypothetical protein U732_24 [Clostridium argentinense CDC 2741]|uniref:Uncharacterized protein n=2 Tax=Clostridium argentinense TaxID=29341 RepID=A0A0C1U0S5_9CLOT|nr:hypothetical protein [Clostridium argentinense]KIE45113.1 hypothetical protein U732_24 [Clostridium argentinense CDC 2741]NFF41328.1 hypothetical protein [Clostridium argentinense]NFP51777.1 hypothetical protein [Clostridium argentinense]NFP74253.1 hypothetical protein [Clostridium argentinense]NFP78356.1 hypothetical protein [Clostridium argentinense]